MILEIKNIDKSYGDRQVLFDLSYDFAECGVVGLIGPNGAGKSTLMKIITGYIGADGGKVAVMGQKVTVDDIETKRNIGYLPEHNPLYVEMYITEYLDFVAESFGIEKRRRAVAVQRVVEATGLTPMIGKRIGELSKGYRQRVGLAAAIIHEPKILILDEPTTGLDPNQLIEIRELIAELGKERLVIFSTHIMQEVDMLCDMILIMNGGCIVVSGGKDELVREYGSIDDLFYKVTKG